MMNCFTFLSDNLWLALALVGLLGLCVGSFLNVVIHRTPLIMNCEWRKDAAWFLGTQSDLDPKHVKPIQDVITNDIPISLSFPPSRCPKCNHQIRAYENIPVLSWLILLRGKCSGCGNPISMRYPLVELITALLSVLVIYTLGLVPEYLKSINCSVATFAMCVSSCFANAGDVASYVPYCIFK